MLQYSDALYCCRSRGEHLVYLHHIPSHRQPPPDEPCACTSLSLLFLLIFYRQRPTPHLAIRPFCGPDLAEREASVIQQPSARHILTGPNTKQTTRPKRKQQHAAVSENVCLVTQQPSSHRPRGRLSDRKLSWRFPCSSRGSSSVRTLFPASLSLGQPYVP